MKKVILTGPPGSGKTTLGEQAARELGMEFVDTDREVMKKFREIYPHGHFLALSSCYSRLERETLEEISGKDAPAIVATGAETPLSGRNADLLKRIGFIVLLRRDMESLAEAEKRWCLTEVSVTNGVKKETTIYTGRDLRGTIMSKCPSTKARRMPCWTTMGESKPALRPLLKLSTH